MKYILIMTGLLQLTISGGYAQGEREVLKYLVREPKIKSENPPVLIMLHGWRSNEKDLFSFAQHIDEKFLVISAQAPYQYSSNGYGWYKVSFNNGTPQIDKQQAEESRKKLISFIDQIIIKYKANKDQVYLMGFSQGAIMSYSVALSRPKKVAGIACFSGRVLQQSVESMSSKHELTKLKVFISHSTNDNVLHYQYAIEGQQLLEKNNAKVTFVSDNVGHSISQKQFIKFKEWLSDYN